SAAGFGIRFASTLAWAHNVSKAAAAGRGREQEVTTKAKRDGRAKTESKIISVLQKAYRIEVDTAANYLANSVHLDDVRAEEVKRSLAEDVTDELGHARRLADRIKQLNGRVPGSLELQFDQESLRPPEDTTDVLAV